MEQQKLIETWKTDYRSKHGIPQGREVSDSELLEQMAIDALKQSRQAAVIPALPIEVPGIDITELANRLYDKWADNYDGRRYMPSDLFTLALQDVIKASNGNAG